MFQISTWKILFPNLICLPISLSFGQKHFFQNYTSERPVSYIIKSIFQACVDHCTVQQGGFLCRDSFLREGSHLAYRSASRQSSCPAPWFSGSCTAGMPHTSAFTYVTQIYCFKRSIRSFSGWSLCCNWTMWSGWKSLCGSQGLLPPHLLLRRIVPCVSVLKSSALVPEDDVGVSETAVVSFD